MVGGGDLNDFPYILRVEKKNFFLVCYKILNIIVPCAILNPCCLPLLYIVVCIC